MEEEEQPTSHIPPTSHVNDNSYMGKKKFRLSFPQKWEEGLRWFDDPLIRLAQLSTNRFVNMISTILTAVTTIELIIVLPFICFFLGYDEVGALLTWFSMSLSIVSQIAKRFIWRSRPWMVARAKLVKKTKTSSFPSRAVTCSVCYIVIIYVIAWNEMFRGFQFEWWMAFILPTSVLLVSFARVQLGVHYPSDCMFGTIQGVIISYISITFWRFGLYTCSCTIHTIQSFVGEGESSCYSQPGADGQITFANFWDRINILLFVLLVLASFFVVAICIVKPFEFWKEKCDRTFGLLLPCFTFHLLVLCPGQTRDFASIAALTQPLAWYGYLLGIVYPVVVMLLLSFVKIPSRIIGFGVSYVVSLSLLLAWRMSDGFMSFT